jgi:hypothetical protein
MNQGVQETEVELIRGIPETLHQQLHEAVDGGDAWSALVEVSTNEQ